MVRHREVTQQCFQGLDECLTHFGAPFSGSPPRAWGVHLKLPITLLFLEHRFLFAPVALPFSVSLNSFGHAFLIFFEGFFFSPHIGHLYLNASLVLQVQCMQNTRENTKDKSEYSCLQM